MTSGPITSWQIDGEKVESVADFIFLGSKITGDCDCSHEIKRHWLLGNYDQPRQHIKKQRHQIADKDPYSQSYGFPVMYKCENRTIEMVEHLRIDAFKLRCWRRLMKVPWTVRRSDQSILKEINLEYSLKGLMIKLKLQYCGHLMRRVDSLEKPLMLERLKAGGEGVTEKEMVGWHHWLNGQESEQSQGESERQGSLMCCSPWDCKELDST